MFKKPLSDLKTSAPLRSSDRRKMKQQIAQTFSLSPEVSDLVVPDGLRSVKFSTHLDEPGVVYLSVEGDPLWFTIGKGSDLEPVPTVYTLWKHTALLPYLSTPAQVIPVLTGGADLMIPGVVQHSPSLTPNQLVSVTQYHPGKVGPPLAVGRMAVGSDGLRNRDIKGKAVIVLHTWKDKLWDLGKGKDAAVPEPIQITQADGDSQPARSPEADEAGDNDETPSVNVASGGDQEVELKHRLDAIHLQPATESVSPSPQEQEQKMSLTPQEVSEILRWSLLQAIHSTLSKLPASAFPMNATTFYTSHLLPSRPAHKVNESSTPVDIKHSAHKSLTAFLKASEKEGLLTLKQMKGDVVVTGVGKAHVDVLAHRPFYTIQADTEKREKQDAKVREEEEKRTGNAKEMSATELWKPYQTTFRFFEETGKDATALYTLAEVKAILNGYISAKSLVNPREQAYINVGADNVLATSLATTDTDFMKREEVLKTLLKQMQPWYELRIPGKDPVVKKGQVKPISVTVKIRQGRKACTLITGFETFALNAEALAEELQHICASSTTVSPLPGKSAGLEVMVQGKQIKGVTQLLVDRGVPPKCIDAQDLSGAKKK